MMLTRRSVTVGSAAVATSALVLGPEALAAPRRRRHAQDVGRGRPGRARLGADHLPHRVRPVGTLYPHDPHPGRRADPGLRVARPCTAPRSAAPTWAPARSRPPSRGRPTTCSRHYVPEARPRSMPTSRRRTDAIGPGHARNKGDRIGAEAARDFLASRADDGCRGNPDIHYTKTGRAPGVWWPNDGPDGHGRAPGWARCGPLFVAAGAAAAVRYPLTSTAWADGLRGGARGSGSSTSTRTSARPTRRRRRCSTTATNAGMALGDAVIRYLGGPPAGDPRDGAHLRPDARRAHGLDHLHLAAEARRGVLASLPGDLRPVRRRQPGHHAAARLGAPRREPATTPTTSAGTGLGRPRRPRWCAACSARRPRWSCVRRPGLRARTPTCRRSSSRPSTPGSGAACTTARR